MAGIFGAISRTPIFDREAASSSLLAIAKQGFVQPGAVAQSECGFAGVAAPHHYSTTDWPISSSDGRYKIAVLGELYLPNGAPLRAHNFDDSFLTPFQNDKDRFLAQLDGAFAFALLSDEDLIVATDPFGTFAIHYGENRDAFVFSSQMQGVVGAIRDKTWSNRGLDQYLGLGMTVSGNTPFAKVSRLQNGSYLHASTAGIKTHSYFRISYHAEDTKATLEEIGDAFEKSVERRSNTNTAVALTGGFDSRVTWSALLRHSKRPAAHTHGLPSARDIKLSRQIGNALNLTRDELLFTNEILSKQPEHWSDFVRLTEGGISLAHTPTMLAFSSLSNRFSVLMDSYGGAFYRRQRMKVAEARIDTSRDLIPQLLSYELSPLMHSPMLRKEARGRIEQVCSDSLREYYGPIADTPHLGDQLDRYHFEQVDAMRDALANMMQMNYLGIAHPFLNTIGIQAAAKLPIAARRRDAFHKYALSRFYPELKKFPMDNVGYWAPYRGFSTLRYLPMAIDKVLQRLRLPSLRHPTMDVEHLLQPFTKELRNVVLSPNDLYDEFINRSEAERAIRLFERGELSKGQPLLQLLTFRLFLAQFPS